MADGVDEQRAVYERHLAEVDGELADLERRPRRSRQRQERLGRLRDKRWSIEKAIADPLPDHDARQQPRIEAELREATRRDKRRRLG